MSQPIVYAVVSRGSVIMAEYTASSGNFISITRKILDKIDFGQNSKMSYVYDRHIFHYIVDSGFVYMCMAEESFGRRIPFAFLEDIRGRFVSQYGDQAHTAVAFAMNTEFAKVLSNVMQKYSSGTQVDNLGKVQGQIDEVKNIMIENIDKVLERGEKIELLVDKTDNLSQQAFQFKRRSRDLKRAYWWKNCKLNLIIFGGIALVLFFVSVIACDGFTFKGCRKHKNNNDTPGASPTLSPSPNKVSTRVHLLLDD